LQRRRHSKYYEKPKWSGMCQNILHIDQNGFRIRKNYGKKNQNTKIFFSLQAWKYISLQKDPEIGSEITKREEGIDI
jgi:hypothetical protein